MLVLHKRSILPLLLVGLLLGACRSADQTPCTTTRITTSADPAEVQALERFVEAQHIAARFDQRGFFYQIQQPGSGLKPTACSRVTVNYSGRLTDGTVFDQGIGVRFGLDQLILGWQEGIPLIAPGGSLLLYLPPSLAYGAQAQAAIPANSTLVFQIDLVAVE